MLFHLPKKNFLRIQYQNFPPGSLTLTLTAYDDHNCPIASKTFKVKIETGKKTSAEVTLDRTTGPCRDAGNDTGPRTDGSTSGGLGTLSTKDTSATVFDSRRVNEGSAPDATNPTSPDASSDQNVIPVAPPSTLPIDGNAPDVPVCQPKKRDCTSSQDNDCNGASDNQETAFCECNKGESQRCQEHQGKDGKGICVAGKQECEFSEDKSTSTWSKTCTGSIGPGAAEVCDPEKKDENCDGQANEGSECVSGTESDCGTCGGKATCVNGKLETCSKLPLPRDCTSDKDNDCNGKPDNEETTYCKCQSGETQDCDTHIGDGTGICKAGTRSCVLSSDKKTSTWGSCTGAVAPKTETCDATQLDEDCDGQINEGCLCANGTLVPCECGGTAPCANGQIGKCSKSKTKFYFDLDGDTYGDPNTWIMACTVPTGYVSYANDCDDNSSTLKPEYSTCDVNTRRYCDPGVPPKSELCKQGCINGACRSDGTVGYAGRVTCGDPAYTANCLASEGCGQMPRSSGEYGKGTCGLGDGVTRNMMYCDGPNDCPPGSVCCEQITADYMYTVSCYVGTACPVSNNHIQICDPLVPNSCPYPKICKKGYSFVHYFCAND